MTASDEAGQREVERLRDEREQALLRLYRVVGGILEDDADGVDVGDILARFRSPYRDAMRAWEAYSETARRLR